MSSQVFLQHQNDVMRSDIKKLVAKNERLEKQHYETVLELCGGEDAPGYAASLDGVEVAKAVKSDHEKWREYDQAEIERLRGALEQVRDIQKPMCGQAPETDWLAWHTTSSQQSEIASTALEQSSPITDTKEGTE